MTRDTQDHSRGVPNVAASPIRFLLRRFSMGKRIAAARLRALCLSLFPGIWFTRVGAGARFFGWPRVQYWGGPISIGRRATVGVKVFFLVGSRGRIVVGDDVNINDYGFLTSLESIEIEDGVSIAEFVSIRDYDHEFDGHTPVDRLGYQTAPIRVCRNAWIGRGVMITKGVTIGEGSVVGANSVVTRDVPPRSVAVGAPARVIRRLDVASGDEFHGV